MLQELHDIKKAKILIVDDEVVNLEILEELLQEDGYQNLDIVSKPEEAVENYKNSPPDLVILDLNMPVLTGFDVIQLFNQCDYSPQPPIIVISAQSDRSSKLTSLETGARDFLNKPFDSQEVIMRVQNLLEMHLAHKENISYSENLEEIVKNRTDELLKTQHEVLYRLALAAEYRDTETAAHTVRVGKFAAAIGKYLGMHGRERDQLELAAPMHDLGKIGIPDDVLLKPGKLDANEWEIMKKHAQFGYDILKDSSSSLLRKAGIIALTHHEKWNGSGYPYGLKQEEIHLYGRITAICDVFDALTMSRPYKKAWSINDAVDLINSESGKHFDPSLVQAFNDILDEFIYIRDKNAD